MNEVIDPDKAMGVYANDRVLAHDDVGPHYLAVDPQSDAVNGFDDSAADPHHDFRSFDVGREEKLDAAFKIDDPASGRALEMARAVDGLAFTGSRDQKPAAKPSPKISGYAQLSRKSRAELVEEVATKSLWEQRGVRDGHPQNRHSRRRDK
jgi:hypothetical protein